MSHTVVDERGYRLSGGKQPRIAIVSSLLVFFSKTIKDNKLENRHIP
jgi:ABC-type transport system involved in cytochrome bd biosynthesis fused ATPase/permease subunit